MEVKDFKKNEYSQGFTLLEVIIVVGLMLVVITASYNLLFHGIFATQSIQEQALLSMEVQPFYYQLEKEIKQARKSEENQPVVRGESPEGVGYATLIFYSDITGDGKPENIKYALENNNLVKSYRVRNSKGTEFDEYPYEYSGNYGNERTVLRNITNGSIFRNIERVNQDPNNDTDHRKSFEVHIEIEGVQDKSQKMYFEGYLMTRSRVEAD
ncbi:PulJ/GspJ family protein [Tindallia californiensis]|uniref:Prepilin-type N-terminal cleavage/methylation domain-containing protein n=1 Tax=Tindallia californiensis TaxID=159292 RepID=A0A1H3NHY6_9FIRM|nr:prepilin-type N-terminal cleavage/methylation domain-containing protein [Tindallia californiensis]SDY88438.1 prepilin-type N-terminal cleavage/methylation domain-containing protein [Tindallia californiensis]